MTSANEGETTTLGTATEPTEITTFGDGEFLRVDTAQQERAVVWSTSASLTELIELVSKTDEIVEDGGAAVRFANQDMVEMSSVDALGMINGPQGALLVEAWLPFLTFSLAWSQAADSRLAEAAMIFPVADEVPVVDLIEQTGTEALQAHGRAVVGRSAILSAQR